MNIDGLVKSRQSGENRSTDGLQLLEKTGFRLSAACASHADRP